MRQTELPLRSRGRPRPWPALVLVTPRQGHDAQPGHSRTRSARHAAPSRGVSQTTRADQGADRGQRPNLRCATACAPPERVEKKESLAPLISAQIDSEVERLIGVGALEAIDFEAVETAAKRTALQLMGQAIARSLNAEHCDDHSPRLPCTCGHTARYAGRRAKTFLTVLGSITLERAWYHCEHCHRGFSPRDRALGLEGTSLSPAALRMTGLTPPGSGTSPMSTSPAPSRSSTSFTPRVISSRSPRSSMDPAPTLPHSGESNDATNSTKAASMPSSPLYALMSRPAKKPEGASTTLPATAIGCRTRHSGPWGCAGPPASSRPEAEPSSPPALDAAECIGPFTAPTPSSPCDARASATASTTSGSAELSQHNARLINLTYTPSPPTCLQAVRERLR